MSIQGQIQCFQLITTPVCTPTLGQTVVIGPCICPRWTINTLEVIQTETPLEALHSWVSLLSYRGEGLIGFLVSDPRQASTFDHRSHPSLTCHTLALQSEAKPIREQLGGRWILDSKLETSCPRLSLFFSLQHQLVPQQCKPAAWII
jgi:hypothetical protein